MDIALLVGLSLLLAIAIGSIAFMYSYYIYSKNRVFSRIKFPILPIAIISILVVCLIILVVLIGLNINSKPNKFMPAYLGLCITLLVLSVGYLVGFILIYFKANKNKVDYLDIANVDWRQKEQELLAKTGDLEAIKTKLSAKNPKYYTSMLEYYKSIVSRVGQKNLSIAENIADIVTFNDAFTHKWCSKLNFYQLWLTYKFCVVFQKNPGQK